MSTGAVRLSAAVMSSLRCPGCRSTLFLAEGEMVCTVENCGARYPVVEGVPVLIDEQRSIFRVADIAVELIEWSRRNRRPAGMGALVRALTPSISRSIKTATNLGRLVSLLRVQTVSPRVLVIGDGVHGEDLNTLLSTADAEIIRTNVAPGPQVALICDPHDLPFEDDSFDAIAAEGVLQRVLDPWRCTREIHRVLKMRGLVYADTPFMQQVNQGTHDFCRFTHLGHRRLFRAFEEIDSGASAGPGMALAWAWRYFLWSFGRTRRLSFLLRTFADFTSFFLTAFDRRLIDRTRALDAAASVYFLGRRSTTALSDRELVAGYRGAEVKATQVVGAPRPVNEVFSEWAAVGWDEEMALNHASSVEEMLGAALAARGEAAPFTAIDAGCGNGWVVRWLRAHNRCLAATGVDCSASMIAKARSLDPEGTYVLADLREWTPPEPVDLVHAMEVLYYLDDPVALLRRIRTEWLRPGGWAVFGVDHYAENAASHSWPEHLGVRMTTWPAERWRAALEEAGFEQVRLWRAAAHDDAPGTLAMLVRTPAANATMGETESTRAA